MSTETTTETAIDATTRQADRFCLQILDSERGNAERAIAWIARNIHGIGKREARRLMNEAIARRDATKGGA